jgi:hypothetical protein
LRFVFPESKTSANLDSNSGKTLAVETPQSLVTTKDD